MGTQGGRVDGWRKSHAQANTRHDGSQGGEGAGHSALLAEESAAQGSHHEVGYTTGRLAEVGMSLLLGNERFGQLEVIGLLSHDPDGEARYRLRCLRCKTDSCTAREDALLAGRVKVCFDCAELARMTPHQRAVLATKRKMDCPNYIPELDRVDVALEVHSQTLTFGEALREAA